MDKIEATFDGEDIWSLVHRGGVGLLSDSVGEGITHDLSKTLLRLAVAGQQGGRDGGPKLTARWVPRVLRKIPRRPRGPISEDRCLLKRAPFWRIKGLVETGLPGGLSFGALAIDQGGCGVLCKPTARTVLCMCTPPVLRHATCGLHRPSLYIPTQAHPPAECRTRGPSTCLVHFGNVSTSQQLLTPLPPERSFLR